MSEESSIADCFQLLGIRPGASAMDVQSAFRAQAKLWHPDRFHHDAAKQKQATERMKRINAARERILSSIGTADSRRPFTYSDKKGHGGDSKKARPRYQATPKPICPSCSAINEADAVYCDQCASRMDKKPLKLRDALATFLVGVVLVPVALFDFIRGPRDRPVGAQLFHAVVAVAILALVATFIWGWIAEFKEGRIWFWF